ncbi:Protein mono-ADP-ribosyltransferase PARP16 [Pseudolycoriella hygida]|uniref:Protein mono-ADP-ribosyltransferase PARP16 n=1 Tax=Pseudolycoriella hygida TaxID=35572 RepID=A0A9Q0S6G1_9DIPT|nr:Protein mono-ADP-ribosyltransferase PARP16 [Pseudolycoriella hygida]
MKRLIYETELTDIPRHYDGLVAFKIEFSTPKEQFLRGKSQFGSFFAYHGSKLENFHSIIHRGLISDLNERRLYGFGTYLTLKYSTAMGFAAKSARWHHSRLFSHPYLSCIAIVEVVDDPSIIYSETPKWNVDIREHRKNCYCLVVNRDELMQLRYLFVFNT